MSFKRIGWANFGYALLIGFMATSLAVGQDALQDEEVVDKVKEQVSETTDQVTEKVLEMGKTLDQSTTAQEVRTTILEPIYQAAEQVGQFSAFYWCAFALMVAGLVSFLLQIVLTKFFLLFKMHINIKEMLGDMLGLLISVIGLILTTQAAHENSSFAESPSAVISATAVGVVIGLVFYVWGQSQEFKAANSSTASSEKSA